MPSKDSATKRAEAEAAKKAKEAEAAAKKAKAEEEKQAKKRQAEEAKAAKAAAKKDSAAAAKPKPTAKPLESGSINPAAAAPAAAAPAAAAALAEDGEDEESDEEEEEVPGQRYSTGSGVYVKRSSGEESLAFVKAYDAAKQIYTVELEMVGSGKTKQSREDGMRAAGASSSSAAAAPVATAAAAAEPLPEGWSEANTAEGKTYFYHKATKKTQWTRPNAATAHAAAEAKAAEAKAAEA